jgi:putative ATP-dependent endonuclease of the OLD family
MKISRVTIQNFRGISSAKLHLPDHGVLIGDNNTGKSTILEALNLALGPDRLNRKPPIDEHDFYQGRYTVEVQPKADAEVQDNEDDVEAAALDETKAPKIHIEAVVTQLNDEQIAHFAERIECWNEAEDTFLSIDDLDEVDPTPTVPALRIAFIGQYVSEEDDFDGQTYFARSLEETPDNPKKFGKPDKRLCGFLYLRALRTGSRALSLEHGSLLDIILRLKELRPQMWEETIQTLAAFDVASNEELGISGVLESINAALKRYVPKEWGAAPRLKVSSLTRDHLRKVITAFMATGEGEHSAPFYRQGTGTINMLVLALLSQIAEDKQNVMFAMEEPETAIPPYAQKRIVHELRKLSAQSLVTSHSPYVLEEYAMEQTVVLTRGPDGTLVQNAIELPDIVKPKAYRREFRTRFCEGLLGRRVLVTEGQTEADALPVVARRLYEIDPEIYASLEALGLTIVDAGSDTKVGPLGGFYKGLGKTVFGLCDVQDAAAAAETASHLDELFMHDEKGFENLVLNNTTEAALVHFIETLDWPQHLEGKFPAPSDDPAAALSAYFSWTKGDAGVAQFLAQCTLDEIPDWIKQTCVRLKTLCEPLPDEPVPVEEENGNGAVIDGGNDQA